MLIQETLRKSFVSRELSTKLRFNVFSSVSHILPNNWCFHTSVLLRWSRFFYQSTCQSTLTNGYKHVSCDREEYLRSAGNVELSGQYFKPELRLPKELQLGTLLQATWQSGMVWGGRRFQGLFFKLIIIEIVRRFSGDPSFKLHGWFHGNHPCTSASEPQLTEVSTLFIL